MNKEFNKLANEIGFISALSYMENQKEDSPLMKTILAREVEMVDDRNELIDDIASMEGSAISLKKALKMKAEELSWVESELEALLELKNKEQININNGTNKE